MIGGSNPSRIRSQTEKWTPFAG